MSGSRDGTRSRDRARTLNAVVLTGIHRANPKESGEINRINLDLLYSLCYITPTLGGREND